MTDTLNAKDKLKKDILGVMEKWDDGHYDGIWYGYNGLYDELECKYTIKELKQAMKELCAEDKVVLVPLYHEDDSYLAGRGWFLLRGQK